jgi:hypothetical protein
MSPFDSLAHTSGVFSVVSASAFFRLAVRIDRLRRLVRLILRHAILQEWNVAGCRRMNNPYSGRVKTRNPLYPIFRNLRTNFSEIFPKTANLPYFNIEENL